jgi:YebC/PmpR family DNA-binding regulatory protein
MAGHSKWANIKHKKQRADAQKGKVFSSFAKEIISAVKQGGADPKANSRLRLVLQKARSANMPTDIIDRNIKKASSADQSDYFSLTYELYGYGGVGLVVEIMTDNKNRIASDMRIATNKRGGSIASPGSVTFNFDQKGVIQVKKDKAEEEILFMLATEAGAEDFEASDDIYFITTPPDLLFQIKDAIEAKGITCDEAGLEMIPKTTMECSEEDSKANQALIGWLEDLEDVATVYHNMQVNE